MINEPLSRGDGYRHGWLGDTGQGKTVASRILAAQPDAFTLIHDDSKSHPEYPASLVVANVERLLAMPLDQLTCTAVSFRGDPWAGVVVEPEEVAALAMQMTRAKLPTRLVIDELDRCLSESGRTLESDSVRQSFTMGRSMGLCVSWGTQTPQRVPQVICDQSSSIGLFRLGPRALNYLDERLFFDPDMLAIIPSLRPGEFVLHKPGWPWDRIVYKFDV